MKKPSKNKLLLLFGILAFTGCKTSTNGEVGHSSERGIHQLQVIGSHNSYKQAIDPDLFEYLAERDTSGGIYSLEYEHIPIIAQLEMGLRNLELDAYADKEGGRFSNPKGMELVKTQEEYDPEGKMDQPGFKVLHVPDIDFRSQYYLLSDCLADLRKWSKENPQHEPVFITLEPKDGEDNRFGTSLEPFTEQVFDQLDETLLHHLGEENIISPNHVRDGYDTLEEAVLHHNWPGLDEGRGKFLFILDTKGEKRELYAKGHPSLKNRLIFINADVGTPEAATLIINDPTDKRIPELVKKGYIIRTRADANTEEARKNDYSQFETAKKSGAQIITTDYYIPSNLFESKYQVRFEDGGYVRDNPLN